VKTLASGKARDMATRKERKLAGSGGRLVAIGAPLIVIGVVLALLLDHNSVGIGVAVAVLGAIPIAVGIALLLSAGVEQRSRKGKPFA
jgi:multidrug efflux pump subunit AcrB